MTHTPIRLLHLHRPRYRSHDTEADNRFDQKDFCIIGTPHMRVEPAGYSRTEAETFR